MSNDPKNAIDMDFVVMKEDYSRYLIHDGTTLKVKIVVRKIFKQGDISPQGYPAAVGIDPQNVLSAIVPPGLKRPPSKEQFDPTKDVGEEVKFEAQEEKWQEYMTPDGFKVSVKPVVTKIFKYKKYNAFGEPIYNAIVQSITNVEKIETTATR